jgi:hypothetical protein
MKKANGYILLLALTMAWQVCGDTAKAKADAPRSSPHTLQDLSFMQGTWCGKSGSGSQVEEYWSGAQGDSLIGHCRFIKDGITTFYELMAIVKTPAGFALKMRHFNGAMIPWVEKDEAGDCLLVSGSANQAIFDNNKADHRVRVTYRKTGTNSLYAKVEDTRDGKTTAYPFEYTAGTGAAAAPQEMLINTPGKSPLQGGVVHDEVLPALPNQFQAGRPFDLTELQGVRPDNNWFPIPDWLAGKWHMESKTIDYMQSYTTGLSNEPHSVVKEVSDVVNGHQRDKSGQIWNFIEIPRWNKVEDQRHTVFLRALQEDVLQSDSSQVVLKVLNNQMFVDDTRHTITGSIMVQQIASYTPVADGLVKLSASLKGFDGYGNPTQLQRCSSSMKRTSTYEDVNSLHGIDLRQLFAEFLKKTGRQDLLP